MPGDEAKFVFCFLEGDMDYIEDTGHSLEPAVEEQEWVSELAFWVPWTLGLLAIRSSA